MWHLGAVHGQVKYRREFEDTLLEARRTAYVTRQPRPVCVGAKHRHFRTLVADIVGQKMKCYAAALPS